MEFSSGTWVRSPWNGEHVWPTHDIQQRHLQVERTQSVHHECYVPRSFVLVTHPVWALEAVHSEQRANVWHQGRQVMLIGDTSTRVSIQKWHVWWIEEGIVLSINDRDFVYFWMLTTQTQISTEGHWQISELTDSPSLCVWLHTIRYMIIVLLST